MVLKFAATKPAVVVLLERTSEGKEEVQAMAVDEPTPSRKRPAEAE